MIKQQRRANREAAACTQYRYVSGCIVPGCIGRVRLHHIVPRRAGGTDAISNLLCICAHHESKLHFAGHVARLQELNPEVDVFSLANSHRTVRKYKLRELKKPQ